MRRAVGSCLVLLLWACGDDSVPRIEFVSKGHGPESVGSLDPLHPGTASALGSGKGRVVGGRFRLKGRSLVRVQHEDPALPAAYLTRKGEELLRLGTSETGFTKHPVLLLPPKVRVGMKWLVRTGDGDDPDFTFEVLERKILGGVYQGSAVWHIRESGKRNIDRLYWEGKGFLGFGKLADLPELWRHSYVLPYSQVETTREEPEAPLLSLEGEGFFWEKDGKPVRFLRGAAFRLSEGGWSGLHVEGSCGEGCAARACLAVDPQGRAGTLGGPGCPSAYAGRAGVVVGDGGPSFAAAEEAEVVFSGEAGEAVALSQRITGMEARNLGDGSARLLHGGWNPLFGTDFDDGLRWSKATPSGTYVYLAGRTALARSRLSSEGVSVPALIGGYDGTLHGSVGPSGHEILLTTQDGAIGRLVPKGDGLSHQRLGVVDLPKGHRLEAAFSVSEGRAVVATQDSALGTWLWPVELPGEGVEIVEPPFHEVFAKMDGDDLLTCLPAEAPNEDVLPGRDCRLRLGRDADPDPRVIEAQVQGAGRAMIVAGEAHGVSDALEIDGEAAVLSGGGFVTRRSLLARGGISLGAPAGSFEPGLGEQVVPDVSSVGLWVPWLDYDGEGIAGLFRLGETPLRVVLKRGAVEDHPKILFPSDLGGVIAELQGQRWFVNRAGEVLALEPPEVDGIHVKVRGYIGPNALCGTFKRPIPSAPGSHQVFLFCAPKHGEAKILELGRDVELLPIEGDGGWTLLGQDFLALRQEGEKKSLVRIHPHTLEILSYPLQVAFDPVSKRSYPRGLWNGGRMGLYGIHRDASGEEVPGRFDAEGFVPFPIRVEGAKSLESVHVNGLGYLRAIMAEHCDESGCVQDVKVVRFHLESET